MDKLRIDSAFSVLPNSIFVFNDIDRDNKLYEQEFMGMMPIWDINILELLNLKELRFIYIGYASIEISKNFLRDKISLKCK